MCAIIIPEGYRSALDIRQTEVAIKEVKDYFERDLAAELNLLRFLWSRLRDLMTI